MTSDDDAAIDWEIYNEQLDADRASQLEEMADQMICELDWKREEEADRIEREIGRAIDGLEKES